MATATPTPRPITGISDAGWAKIVEAAKKEGKLVMYGAFHYDPTPGEAGDAVKKGMKQFYGIDVEILRMPASTAIERYRSEARGGVYYADIVSGTAADLIGIMVPEGHFRPFTDLPVFRDLGDPRVWYVDPFTVPEVASHSFSWAESGNWVINADIVGRQYYPTSIRDVLQPFFKGKVCMDNPAITNIPETFFWRTWRSLDYADWWLETWHTLANRASGYLALTALMGGPLAISRGECAIMIQSGGTNTPGGPSLLETWVGERGVKALRIGIYDPPIPASFALSHMSDTILKKAPHPNAALVFTNWVFSQEGKDWLAKFTAGNGGVRKDVPNHVEKEWRQLAQEQLGNKAVDTGWKAEADWHRFESYSYSRRIAFRLITEGMTKDAWLKEIRDTSQSFWGHFPPPKTQFISLGLP